MILRILMIFSMIAGLWLPAFSADSTPADPEQPVQVTADRLEADEAARRMKFVGNVVARQGDVTIYAQELTLILAEVNREVDRIEAVGDVRIVQGERIATGQQGVFYRGEGRIVLSGSPRVHQGEDFIEGDEITVFLNSEKSIVKSREGTRVNAIFHPRGESRP